MNTSPTRATKSCGQRSRLKMPVSQGVKRIRPTIVEDDYDLWIYHDKPCVRVFAEELAAMMFVLGITYGESDSVGAFGTILTTHKDGHYSTMRLAHSRWETKLHLGGGSGYSTIFAKHMACGCLPFAETVGAEGTPVVHTIMISKATKEVLISGGVILDDKPPGTSPTTQSWKYLGSLPSIAGHGLFYPISSESEYLTTYLKDTKSETGAIYWKFNPNNPKDRSVDAELIASWRDAVAGIAFGGLVPMASNHLVDTIVWSVGGELEGRDFKKLLELLVVIDRHAAERIGVEVVPIFSAGVQRIAAMMSDFGDVDSDYYLFDKFRSSVEATWSLDQLTTALEYLLAWAGSPTNNGGLPEKRVSDIECAFKSCANKVGESMKSKGKQKQSNEKTEVEIILEEVIRKLQGKEERPSLDDCGKVAWCIIKAWTQLVKKVSWPDDGEEPQSYEYRPPRLEQLPHVLAWE
ncbi:hypothetical protein GQ53DRAFT_867616 [Thozetella sp. PMI_491]|nr:hypothetical protein GQ53DRAFT_867616 [Thozetella sp. PMI_491]